VGLTRVNLEISKSPAATKAITTETIIIIINSISRTPLLSSMLLMMQMKTLNGMISILRKRLAISSEEKSQVKLN
jgi:hypothetical protein